MSDGDGGAASAAFASAGWEASSSVHDYSKAVATGGGAYSGLTISNSPLAHRAATVSSIGGVGGAGYGSGGGAKSLISLSGAGYLDATASGGSGGYDGGSASSAASATSSETVTGGYGNVVANAKAFGGAGGRSVMDWPWKGLGELRLTGDKSTLV